MGNDEEEFPTNKYDYGTKRKTTLQLEALENFYSEVNYPSQKAMEDYASVLKLTYKQVRGWFVERRRKEKRERGVSPSSNNKKRMNGCGRITPRSNRIFKQDTSRSRNVNKTQLSSKCNRLQKLLGSSHRVGNEDRRASAGRNKNSMQKRKIACLQDLLPPEYILKKIFRKDGPPLGVEFDPLPPGAFCYSTDPKNGCPPTSVVNQRAPAPKRRKVLKLPISDSQACTKKSGPVMKHGVGKGLMTVWHATNPNARGFPTGISSAFSKPQKPLRQQTQRSCHQRLAAKQRLGDKLQDRKKRATKKTKVGSSKDENPKKAHQVECKLALEGQTSQEYSNALTTLVDDEDLELRELQAGPNTLTCSAHLASNGMHGCSLCQDLLARFPPHSVKMKQPLRMQPWGSSPELVKKLFKVFRFVYSQAVAVDMCPFTLDEFVQAFHDKDSLLLGRIHVALLKLLLSHVEMELSSGFLSHASKDCRFLVFLHSVKRQEFVVKFWNRSLNPLTWTEILHQVLVAAGFSSRQSTLRRETLNKEGNPMEKYGLRPHTLKGELFTILTEQGNNGLKVSELAKAFQIVELNLTKTTDELELLICSTLSSDITLFEKISPFAYRLRINPLISKGAGDSQSDSEDSGSVDDDNSGDSSGDDSESDSVRNSLSIVEHKGHCKKKNDMLVEYTEIDESHSGEAWMLGLIEGEYSDLRIEEKLNALVALVDLTSAGSSIRMEDPVSVSTERVHTIQHHGGAKIKRSSANQYSLPRPLRVQNAGMLGMEEMHTTPEFLSLGSSAPISKEMGLDGHPLQSVCLGSDRRHNSYWLFLGPCNAKDPGHRRVYFESSEDGHWEVIDTEEALCALLSALDRRGMREAHLLTSLEKREAVLCQAMSDKMANDNETRQSPRSDQSAIDIISGDDSSPISDVDSNRSLAGTRNDSLASSGAIVLELGKTGEEKKQKWDRLQAFDAWVWNSFYSNLNVVKHGKRSYVDSLARCESCHDLYWRDEKHCRICHVTFELDFDLEERYAIHVVTCREKEDTDIFPRHKVLSSQLQTLKAAIHAIEAVMPKDALDDAWTSSAHKLWVKRLRRTSSMPELLQVLADFVGTINEDWLCQHSVDHCSNTALDEIIVFFPTMPQTTSAVALWLVKLDALIAPHLERVHSEKALQRSTRRRGRCGSN